MYHIIVNPASKSGLGRTKWKELKKLLLKEMVTYNVQFTTPEHMSAYKCVRQLTSKDFPKPLHLIVLGGDGTINEVLNGIQDFENTILTYLPAGSSNDLARDMEVNTMPAALLYKCLKTKQCCLMDYGTTHYKGGKRRFLVSSGIGFDAEVCNQALHSTLKNVLNLFHLGKLTYGLIAIKLLFQTKPVSAEIYLDGSETPIRVKRLLFCAAMNHRYEGGGFMFAPDADATDGSLDICLVSDIKLYRVIYLLPLALKGKHRGHKGIQIFSAKDVTVKTSIPLTVHTDGEICGKFNSLHLTCTKQALKYV